MSSYVRPSFPPTPSMYTLLCKSLVIMVQFHFSLATFFSTWHVLFGNYIFFQLWQNKTLSGYTLVSDGTESIPLIKIIILASAILFS